MKQKVLNQVCDYSDASILVTGDVLGIADNDADVAFKTCAPFCACKTKINDVIIDEPNHIYIAMPMYNLIEYSDNYSDTSRRAWHFKSDEAPNNNADLTTDNSQLFKYKSALVEKTEDALNNTKNSVKSKDFCSIKVSQHLLEIVRNTINQLQNSSWIKLDWRMRFIKC